MVRPDQRLLDGLIDRLTSILDILCVYFCRETARGKKRATDGSPFVSQVIKKSFNRSPFDGAGSSLADAFTEVNAGC
jgi:hypothetical protein